MKETEILFIQVHWLFKFEEKEFKTFIPNTDHYARFIDEDSPINHSEHIRGYGGVAIVSVLVFVSDVFWVGLLDSFSIVGVDGIVAGLSVVLLVYPLWLRHGRILNKAVGMGCLRVFEHPLVSRLGAKQKVGKRIKIGSLNIQNIRGNTIFVQSVMKETEILFIQEHWLFKFEDSISSNILYI
jgi:hypothetical protein